MKFEFSAGGVVQKKENEQLYILLAQHSQHHGWVFPKGLIGDNVAGEKKEATAIREVEEETGVLAKLGKALTPVTYWYQFEGEKRKKTVYYYLMDYISEDPSKKDDEMENVTWLPIEEVEQKLTYPSDRQAWQEAKQFIVQGS
ncbi:MAG: NUDIX domain-containing protein [Candidatus Levybacteria bacterium]|nr:NUDIX domain-containing protein [Candidatus Levybacteria bacterium]